ncbi:MAG: FAD:protein FMN transferase [Methylococcaceae bacterium]|nr:FAD:protein FMN transferase [Methylococcaceae bacterium]
MALQLFKYPFTAMGSPCEIQLYAASVSDAAAVAQSIIHDIERLESKYSRYRPDSFLAEINRAAAKARKIAIDDETASLLHYAQTCYEQSDGLFDISSGVLRKLWDFKQSDAMRIPNPEHIQRVLQYVGWDKVRWTSSSLAFSAKNMELDFGGIVKEYAADRAASIAYAMKLKYGIVNLGGDIRVIGPHPDGSPWRIGVQDPRHKNAVLKVVALEHGAMASSGDYERCIQINGQRYSHILNPQTGFPVNYLAAVTVTSDLCVLAGSASTIAMLKADQGMAWLSDLGLPHLWVTVDGKMGGDLVDI